MNPLEEEALYDFLDNADAVFGIPDIVSHIRKAVLLSSGRLTGEVKAYINSRRLAFPSGTERWMPRRVFFSPIPFVISPTRLELLNGILIPGHRCVPFASSELLPQEYSFFWREVPVPFTTSEGPPEDFYPYYTLFGEEYAPQYVARDNAENEEAFNADPYEDPPEVSIKTLDMRNIYRETSFVPGDRFVVRTRDWKSGSFDLEKAGKDEWAQEELDAWFAAAEKGFEESFANQGTLSCTEEQIAWAYWYGGNRMREVPAYALEEYLYEKTERVETAAFGIETRFWYAGREIPDRKELDTSGVRPDATRIEAMLCGINIPVSEFVIQSYIRDSLYRGDELLLPDGEGSGAETIAGRIIPGKIALNNRDRNFLLDYITKVKEEFRDSYSEFTDKDMGPVRQRAGELHTAVIELAAQLKKGGIDASWLPKHTFIVFSQIQQHTAGMLEDMDSEEAPPTEEIEAIDNSLDSMVETFEEIKELISEAMNNFRRNTLAVIKPGTNAENFPERLVQLSIGGTDVWRRIIVPKDCELGELHLVIQAAFGWRNSESFGFNADRGMEKKTDGEKTLPPFTRIDSLFREGVTEFLYEYGTRWVVRIMILSALETPGRKPVRCVAGVGAAPPESIGGPLKFKRILSALESGNNLEQLAARRELGTDFTPGEFDIDGCNRGLVTKLSLLKGGK